MSTNHGDIMWTEMWGYYERQYLRRVKERTTDSGAQVPSRVTERLDAIERNQAKQARQLAEIEKKYPWGGY